jgi:hypothetical protein
MSVQLIVYPQNYDGTFNSITSTPTQFVVNGINFTGLNSAPNYDSSSATPSQDTINNAQPTIPNSWYRFRSTIPSVPSLPAVSLGKIILYIEPAAVGSVLGVYQKLGNLAVGQQYEVSLTMAGGSDGSIISEVYDGTTLISSSATAVGASIISHTFTSTAPDNIIMVYYSTTISDLVEIDTIGITQATASPSGSIQILGDGQVICDLYEDEDLPLTLSVDDFKNVAEKVQSYSKAFNLPATKRNNLIFDAIFEVTRAYDGIIFNPYKRTKCVLKQDGFILFEGYLRMLDVTDKEGEISYNVNLYSEVIALADTLKDRAFRDLDFTELEHDYNRTQITASWNDAPTFGITYTNPSTSGFRDANDTVKYPFVDWDHQIFLGGSSGSGNSAIDDLPELPTLETAFRPFINIKYLIDRIFNAPNTPFTYESAFFNTTDFKKLFMDFNWGADNAPTSINTNGIAATDNDLIGTSSWQTMLQDDNNYTTEMGYSAGTYTAINDTQTYNIDYYFNLYSYQIPSGTALAYDMDFRWELVKGGVTTYVNQFTITGTGDMFWNSWSGNLLEILDVGDTLTPQFKTTTAATHISKHKAQNFVDTVASTSSSSITTDIFLQTLRGELGQWEFLKGLITMFNLVTLVDEDNPNNILIEPYTDVFIPTATGGTTLANRGIQHDWTDKIDVSEMKLTPLTDLNRKTIFKFVEDDDDYSFNQYKNNVGGQAGEGGHLYGSLKHNATDEFNILDGEEEIIAEPFAATLVKPLMSQFPSFIVPAIYAMNDDVEESFENSPRIMYNNGIKSTGVSYYIPAQNGGTSTNETNFLQFSHLTEVPTSSASPSTTIDFHFGVCQLMTGVGSPTPNNLFNLYWLPYYSELYNPNTRTMTLKVNLSPADINTFRFNDRVFIKNRVFRVNKIDYKPNDLATVEFILIP